MSDKFSQLLPMLGAIVAFLFAALLLVYIVRLVFGRRIRAPGARNRPRRLDIVDVFDLDKERQLVIVRRDNTEHLLLIGGPNDVLVESAISRVEGVGGRTEASRAETSSRAASTNWPAGPAADEETVAPTPAPAKPAAPTGLNLPPEITAPKPAAPRPATPPPLRPATPPTAAEPAPVPPTPVLPAPAPAPGVPPARPMAGGPPPLRPAAPTRQGPPPFLARTQQLIKPKSEEGDAPASGEVKMAPPPLPPRPAAPPLRPAAPPLPPRPVLPAGDAPLAGGEPTPPQVRMGIPPQRPAAPPPVPPAPPAAPAGDALESLEEEMARLLGRPEKE
jgi:flagellar protein FliO/FliZ